MPAASLAAMNANDGEIRFGALCWNQYSDWPAFLDAGKHAEQADFTILLLAQRLHERFA